MVAVSIGDAARQSGVKIATIRYYEEIGLLPQPSRSEGNRREYDHADLQRLAFVRHARELGFGIDAIRTLLQLQDQPEQPCEEADAIARARLADVEQRLTSLQALRVELVRMVEHCTKGAVAHCRVIEVLTDHNQCMGDHSVAHG